MRQLVILSDRCGTGKTTVAAALADLACQESPIVMVDANIDVASLAFLVSPQQLEEHDFVSGKVAVVDPQKCTACAACLQACRFSAIIAGEGTYSIEPSLCQGCHSCFYQCPEQAIHMEGRRAGQWFRSVAHFGPLYHAHSSAGQESAGKLIRLVRQQARQMAFGSGAQWLLIDGPSGSTATTVAASMGADLALLVAEPSISRIDELESILAMLGDSRVSSLLCINQADARPAQTASIEAWCRARGVLLAGKLPYDPAARETMAAGRAAVTEQQGALAAAVGEMWARIGQEVRKKR